MGKNTFTYWKYFKKNKEGNNMRTKKRSLFQKSLSILMTLSLLFINLSIPKAVLAIADVPIQNLTGTSISEMTRHFGQSFTPTSNITVSAVMIKLQGWSEDGDDNVHVQIKSALNGGALIAESTGKVVSSATEERTFSFVPFNLNGGQMYYLFIKTENNLQYYFNNQTNDGYINGSRLIYSENGMGNEKGTYSETSGDLFFQITYGITQYTLTFNSNGGSSVAPITQSSGTAITKPTDPTREGYTFAKWLPEVPLTMPAYNQTLNAQWTVNQYSISFNSNGGSPVDSKTQSFGTAIEAPVNPTRPGYTFAGWSPAVPTTMPAYNQTLNAQWTLNTYTLTFNSDGGTYVDPITLSAGIAITKPTNPTKLGHTFTAWDPAIPETMPASNQTLNAQWAVNEYTLTFNSDGGSFVAPIKQNYNTSVVAPANPTRPGYTFLQWSPIVPSTMPASNQTLIAQWAVNGYTLTFDSSGGSFVAPITQSFGTAVVTPVNPTRLGFAFTGWSPVVPATMPAGDATLVAQWAINGYTLTFNSDGGSFVAPITQNYNTSVVAPANPTRPGYTFLQWSPIVPSTMPASNQTLIAQWTINTYTLTFNSNGGSLVAPITQSFGTAVVTPVNPTRLGFAFTGWSPAVPATMPDGNATLIAQWEMNTYTLTFDSNGGSLVTPITQNYNTEIVAPANPTRPGYTFAGWSPAVPTTMPASNQTLIAQWTINTYTLTFNSNGGSLIEPITQDFGTNIVPPLDPTRLNYNFVGWNPEIPATMPAGDATLVAEWAIQTYTLTFDSNGGSLVTPITQNYNTTVVAPANPSRPGYTFAGWLPVVPATMPNSDTTLVAQWAIIVPVNTAPTSAAATYTILSGASITRLLARGDADGNPLTFQIVTLPIRGILVVTDGGSFTYTNNGLDLTSDTFTYRVFDGALYSPISTIRINLADQPIENTAPVIKDASFSTPFNTALNEDVAPLGSDADANPLTFVLVTLPANGTLTLSPSGSFNYVPNAIFSGADSFTFKSNDGTDDSNISTITINVGKEITITPDVTPQAQMPWWWLLALLPFLLFLIRRPRPEVQEVVMNPDGTITTTWGYLGPRLMHKDYDRDESILEVVSGDVKVVPTVENVPYEFDRGRHSNIFKTVSDKNAVIRWTINKKAEELDKELVEKMLEKNKK